MRVFTTSSLLFLLSCSILPITANAYYIPHVLIDCVTDIAWFAGIGGGPSWVSLSSSTSVENGSGFPAPFNRDRFTIDSPTAGIAQLYAGISAQSVITYIPSLSAYVQYRHYFSSNIRGNITQYSVPEFQNYTYKMSYEADLFTINGKAGLYQVNQFTPYLSAGIGFISNYLYDYSETARPGVTPRVSPAYQGHTKVKLAATLGVGIDYLLNKCTTITLGYDHVFQGNIESGPGLDTWASTRLNFGNANLDTVFVNVTANFPQI